MIAFALLLVANTPSSCESLRALSTPQTIVMSAEVVPAGVFVPPPQPPPAGGPPPGAAGRRQAGKSRRAGCTAAARADSAALPREADAEALL